MLLFLLYNGTFFSLFGCEKKRKEVLIFIHTYIFTIFVFLLLSHVNACVYSYICDVYSGKDPNQGKQRKTIILLWMLENGEPTSSYTACISSFSFSLLGSRCARAQTLCINIIRAIQQYACVMICFLFSVRLFQ